MRALDAKTSAAVTRTQCPDRNMPWEIYIVRNTYLQGDFFEGRSTEAGAEI